MRRFMARSRLPVSGLKVATAALGLAALIFGIYLVGATRIPILAQAAPLAPQERALSGVEVIDALRAAGLVGANIRQLPTSYATPSGPPATEREAWAFDTPALSGAGGRVLVFDDDAHLQAKGAWFRRVGVNPLVVRNVMVWLDPGLSARDLAAYKHVLDGL